MPDGLADGPDNGAADLALQALLGERDARRTGNVAFEDVDAKGATRRKGCSRNTENLHMRERVWFDNANMARFNEGVLRRRL